jgi:hypothetical protein
MNEGSPLLQSVNSDELESVGLFSPQHGFEPLSFVAEDPGEAMLLR